jgi:hypothetical protein
MGHDHRDEADHQLWQYADVRVEVEADAYVGVEPFLPQGVRVERVDGRFVIAGAYGADLFTDHRFTILVDGVQRVYTSLDDIPERFDNVIHFAPDATHDITFVYTFERGGQRFAHSHWIHHDMEPWNGILRSLLTRETNGGWTYARRDPNR